MSWWWRRKFQIFIQAKRETEWQNQNTSNTYVIDPNASDNYIVTDHAHHVGGYDPPVMLHMLQKNLWPPKGAI